MILHGSLDQGAEYFLDRLGVSTYLNFTASMSDIPDDASKLPYVREMDPSKLPSPEDIASMVRNSPPGTIWYVGGEPNRKGVGWEGFADTFNYYYTHITAADPTARLTGPSVLNWDFTCIGCGGFQQGKVWLTNFINAYESKYGQPVPVGAWAIDVYPIDWNNTANNDPDRPAMYNGVPTQHWRIAVDQLESMRQDLDELGYADTPIWITEIAIHVGYEAWRWVDFPNELTGVGDYR